MKGKIAFITVASVTFYVFLVLAFFVTMPLMITWGAPLPWYLKMIGFMETFPFSWSDAGCEPWWMPLICNAFFWTLILIMMGCLLVWLRMRKQSNKNRQS